MKTCMNECSKKKKLVIITDGEKHQAHHDQVTSSHFLPEIMDQEITILLDITVLFFYTVKSGHVNWTVLVSEGATL